MGYTFAKYREFQYVPNSWESMLLSVLSWVQKLLVYLPIQVKEQDYSYKVKFLASSRKAVVQELYNYHDKFDSVDAIQQKLKEEFSEHIAVSVLVILKEDTKLSVG